MAASRRLRRLGTGTAARLPDGRSAPGGERRLDRSRRAGRSHPVRAGQRRLAAGSKSAAACSAGNQRRGVQRSRPRYRHDFAGNGARSSTAPVTLTAGPPGTVGWSERPGDIRLEVAAPSRQLLVLAESFHSGWRAEANGVAIPIVRTNGDFLGCVVDPNMKSVRFRFAPDSLRYGKLLSILGLSLLGLLAFAGNHLARQA